MPSIGNKKGAAPGPRKSSRLAALVAVGLIVLGGVVALVITNLTTPSNIKRNYEALVVPQAFRLGSANYYRGNIDVAPHWTYEYSVSSTRQLVHDEWLKALEAGGYTIDNDGGWQSDDITASSAKRRIVLSFNALPNPKPGTEVQANDPIDKILVDVQSK